MSSSLKETVIWARTSLASDGKPRPTPQELFVRDEQVGSDALTVATAEAGPVSVEISDRNPAQERAERFVDALQGGLPPAKAAAKIGTTMRRLNSNAEMKAAIAELVQIAEIPAEIKRAAVRAGLFRMFVENLDSEPDISLKAAKQMAKDPEMGLEVEAPVVSLNLGGPLAQLFENFQPFPGVPPPKTIDTTPVQLVS